MLETRIMTNLLDFTHHIHFTRRGSLETFGVPEEIEDSTNEGIADFILIYSIVVEC